MSLLRDILYEEQQEFDFKGGQGKVKKLPKPFSSAITVKSATIDKPLTIQPDSLNKMLAQFQKYDELFTGAGAVRMTYVEHYGAVFYNNEDFSEFGKVLAPYMKKHAKIITKLKKHYNRPEAIILSDVVQSILETKGVKNYLKNTRKYNMKV